ncbi:hypothetical protein O3M35_002483 [Rhynocoris fuscipes]|uniref:BESS domain-containing protein n=1 Tax=Rhynocoris fuscipes TaxID=488301 RepID=A0AAW1CM05_9HEMI
MTRTRLKKLLKAEHFKTEADEDEQSLIENVEVDIMPNEALLHAVTHLEEDEEGTVDINEDHHDNTMNVAINPAFAFNYTNMMNTNNTNRNHDNRKPNSTPSTNEPERKRRRHIEDDLKTLRPGEVDDTYHFLISLREPLKSLTLDRQMYVRYKIQELLFNETSESQKNVQNESTEPLETSDIIAVGNIKTEPPDST